MTDQQTPRQTADEGSNGAGAATGTDEQADAMVGLVTDGAYALIAAVFSSTEDAESAYTQLTEIERNSRFRIDGVVVASRDAEGQVHLGKVTDHSTKPGLKWGVVGGVALGILFPP